MLTQLQTLKTKKKTPPNNQKHVDIQSSDLHKASITFKTFTKLKNSNNLNLNKTIKLS